MSRLDSLNPVEEHLSNAMIALANAVRDDPALARMAQTRELAELLTAAQRQLGDLKHSLRSEETVELCPPSEGLPEQTQPPVAPAGGAKRSGGRRT